MTTQRPTLRLTRVHIRGLRGLEHLNLPEDGMSWGQDGIPDLVVMAGANGTGKTTFLRCMATAAECLIAMPAQLPSEVAAVECLIDFQLLDGLNSPVDLRFLVGTPEFVAAHRTEHSYGYAAIAGNPTRVQRLPKPNSPRFTALVNTLRHSPHEDLPGVVFIPADNRDLVVPDVSYMAPGRLESTPQFVSRWSRLPTTKWSGSTMELLYSARWADLNAIAAGAPERAVQFGRFADAFNAITGGSKKLTWLASGELVVELDRVAHPIEDLSAGERQLLLLLAELRRFWRPGSLILIDEPELHLHDHWQGRLLDVLEGMQKELGGQVILATQSQAFFEMAGVGTRVILGRCGLR